MFQPEAENDDSEEFYQYSVAGPVRSVGMYAQDGAGTSLGMAYQLMYNRFRGFTGYGNRYNYYNPYHYGGYYNNSYTLAGYTMYVPVAKFPERGTPRTWSRDGKSPGTNLTTTRTTTESDYTNTNGADTNSSNVSSTRSSTGSSSSSSSSSTSSSSKSSAGGRRVTKRN
jgi:hypothetical protein